jgi:hypothetical protein
MALEAVFPQLFEGRSSRGRIHKAPGDERGPRRQGPHQRTCHASLRARNPRAAEARSARLGGYLQNRLAGVFRFHRYPRAATLVTAVR